LRQDPAVKKSLFAHVPQGQIAAEQDASAAARVMHAENNRQ